MENPSLVMVSVKYTLPRQINYFIRGISRKGNTGPQWKYCGTCVERDHSRGQTGIGYMTTTYYCYDPNPPKSSLHLWPISLFPPPTWSSIFFSCTLFYLHSQPSYYYPFPFEFIMGSEVRRSPPLSAWSPPIAIPHSPI